MDPKIKAILTKLPNSQLLHEGVPVVFTGTYATQFGSSAIGSVSVEIQLIDPMMPKMKKWVKLTELSEIGTLDGNN